MSVSYPRTDVLSDVGFLSPDFVLTSRQEVSRTAGGQTIVKEFGPQIWKASFQTVPMEYTDGISFEALLNSLDNGLRTFTLYDMRRPYPKNYPTGSFTDGGSLASIGSNRNLVTLSGLPASFALSAGDYFSFTYSGSPSTKYGLHQLVESVTADGSGATGTFEVRPAIRDEVTSGATIQLKLPPALFRLVPGSVRQTLKGPPHMALAFDAVEAL